MPVDDYPKIEKASKECLRCNKSLEDSSKHPSTIKKKGFEIERLDFCPECWELVKNEEDYFGYWLTKREKQEPKVPKKQKKQAL